MNGYRMKIRYFTGLLILFIFQNVSYGVDKSGVDPNTISLPSGPGTIEGLGEAFQPTLNTGTAKYNVALTLTPGTTGHTPALHLTYESGSGNGCVGYGWSLPMAYVQRQTDQGIPHYVDSANEADDDFDGDIDEMDELDGFINEIKEELVPVASEEETDFFCKTEGTFVRYRRVNDYWEGRRPDGTLLIFGQSASARIVDANDASKVFRWLIEKEVDTNGNTIVYHYTGFPGSANINQKYCSKIEYGPGGDPWENFHFVLFKYEDRADWFEDGRSGFLVRTGKRLTEIVMGTQGPILNGHVHDADLSGDEVNDNLNRIYRLTYHEDHWSKLKRVTPVGADGVGALPSSTFEYTVCKRDTAFSAADKIVFSENEPIFVFNNDNVEFIDMNGDALPDLLRTDPTGNGHTVAINQGPFASEEGQVIRWGKTEEVSVPVEDPGAWNVRLDDGGVAVVDMVGNGLSDLCQITLDKVFYFKNESAKGDSQVGWSSRQEITTQDSVPLSPFNHSEVGAGDIDFNKLPDLMQTLVSGNEVSYRIWYNLNGKTYSNGVVISPETGYDFTDPGVQLADFNGDRIPDMTRVRASTVAVTAGLGYDFAPEIVVAIPADEPLTDDQLKRARLRDITGDGLVDLVVERAVVGELWFWLNMGNYSFDVRRVIRGMPVVIGADTETRWVDLNGNGTTDIVYADTEQHPQKLQMVDIGELIDCAPRPHMIKEITNGIGRITKIEYTTSTKFALEDGRDAGGNYEYSWPDPLPFPIDVVSRIRTLDSLGNEYITDFQYHDGFYDPEEKQFRGFERVEQIDIGDDTAPTQVMRHQFDTGRDQEALKGKLLRQSAERVDNNDGVDNEVFWEEETTWETRALYSGIDAREVIFAFSKRQVRDVLELGNDPVTLQTDFDYDIYGNMIMENNHGIISGPEWTTDLVDERFITRSFALNLEKWIVRTIEREEIMDGDGQVISRNETYYDDPMFSGSNLGEVTIGNPSLVKNWIDPDDENSFILSARTRYDDLGNPVTILDPLAVISDDVPNSDSGHFREVVYDDRFKTYPLSETIHVGNGSDPLVMEAGYDEGFGTVTRSTDFNGHITTYGYDEFARFINVVKPGDSQNFPTIAYDYVLGQRFGDDKTINYIETRLLDKSPQGDDSTGASTIPSLNQGIVEGTPSRDFYYISRSFVDGLGRPLMTKEETDPDSSTGNPKVVVKGAVQFNARKTTRFTLQPYYSGMSEEGLEHGLEFEDINSSDWRGQFHDRGELVTLNLDSSHKIRLHYDELLRKIRTTNPDTTETRIEFLPLVTQSLDENDLTPDSIHFNTPVHHYSDGLGRLIRIDDVVKLNDDGTFSEEVTTWTTHFEYRADGPLLWVVDAQGNQKLMNYDGLSRKTFQNDPNRGVMNYTYDNVSNLVETVDAKGQKITYTYDGVNRLTSEDYHDAFGFTPDVTYHYDKPFGSIPLTLSSIEIAQNTKGFLSYVVDLSGEEHNSYDERGRVKWVVKRVPDPETGEIISYKVENEYDSMDRVIKLLYPDNDLISYIYNERNLLERIDTGLVEKIDYTPSGQRLHCRYGNGTSTDYAYDRRLRMGSLMTLQTSTPEDPLISYKYGFDGVSNITSIEDRRPDTERPEGNKRRNTQIFAYDNLYRLLQVQYSLTLPGQDFRDDGSITYRYDRIGNMLAKDSDIDHRENGFSVTNLGTMSYGEENNVGGDVPVGDSFGRFSRIGRNPGDAPGPHALTSTSEDNRVIDYDGNGNMFTLEGGTLTWDFKNRLIRYEKDAIVAEYIYDYSDRRIVKSIETRNSKAESRNTIYVNKLFEMRDNQQPTKYAFDKKERCARFTKMLDTTTEKIQWLRLRKGWNFVSLYVQPVTLSIGDIFDFNGATSSIWRFDNDGKKFVPVDSNESVSPATAYMVFAEESTVRIISGIYMPHGTQTLTPGVNALAWPLSRGFDPKRDFAEEADIVSSIWSYFPESSDWHGYLPHHPTPVSTMTNVQSPGKAAFLTHTSDIQFTPNMQKSSNIRFYHGDHLGSTNLVTDGEGNLVEETVFFPYGHPRHHYKADKERIIADYRFTGKEQDQESGLHYFEARYYAGHLAKFISTDPLQSFLKNPYAYVENNPMIFTDPTGMQKSEYQKISKGYISMVRNNAFKKKHWHWGNTPERLARKIFTKKEQKSEMVKHILDGTLSIIELERGIGLSFDKRQKMMVRWLDRNSHRQTKKRSMPKWMVALNIFYTKKERNSYLTRTKVMLKNGSQVSLKDLPRVYMIKQLELGKELTASPAGGVAGGITYGITGDVDQATAAAKMGNAVNSMGRRHIKATGRGVETASPWSKPSTPVRSGAGVR